MQVFLFAANFESNCMISWPSCQDSFKMAAFKVDLSRQISSVRTAGSSEAETSVSGKAECLLAIGEDKKVSFLE